MKRSSKQEKKTSISDLNGKSEVNSFDCDDEVNEVAELKIKNQPIEKHIQNEKFHSKIIGFSGLGGAGTRVAISTIQSGKTSGMGPRLAIDIDRDYPSHKKDGIDIRLLRGDGSLTATAGRFSLSEKMLTDIIRNPAGSFDEETANALETYLIGSAGKQYNLLFLIAATGGGTGNGFMRAILNRYGNRIKSRLAPIGIIPHKRSPPLEYLNSLTFFGMMDRIHSRIGIPTFICVENDALERLSGSKKMQLMNNIISGSVRLMAYTLSRSLAQDYSWGNIDRGFVDFYSPDRLSISTFGISRNVKVRGIGINSVKKAFLRAHTNNLLGLHPQKYEAIGSKLDGIVFVNAPESMDPGKIKEVIQNNAKNVWRYADYEIKEVFVSTDCHVTSIDMVVLFGGQITPPMLYKKISRGPLIRSNIEKRAAIYDNLIDKDKNGAAKYYLEAKKDLNRGYLLLDQMMRRR